MKCDLKWADEQYLCDIIELISEYFKLVNKKGKEDKKKVDSSSMKKFIRKEE